MGAGVGNRRWQIMGLFFLCYTVLYMARASIGITGPSMMEYYGWSKTQYGMLASAFFWGYICTMFAGGALADKIGGGKVVCGGAILWSIFVFITPLPNWASALVLIIIIRAACGVSQGVALPAISSMIARWVPKNESGLAQGVTLIGVAFGLAITPVLSAWVMHEYGWKMVFWSFALLGPIWVLIWWKWGYSSPAEDPNISQTEKDYIEQSKAAAAAQAGASGSSLDAQLDIHSCYSMPALWIGALSMLATHYLFYFYMAWLPTYFVDGRHMELTRGAWASAMPYIVAMFTYPLGGGLADKCSRMMGENWGRKIVPIVGLLISAIFLYFATTVESNTAIIALISVSNGALCLTMGGYYSIPIVFSRKHAGKLVGLWATFATAGGIIAPMLTGVLVQNFSYDFALAFAAAMAGVAALLLACVKVAPFAEILAGTQGSKN